MKHAIAGQARLRSTWADRDVSNRRTLIDVVAKAGLERQRAEAMLNSDEEMNAIKEAEDAVQKEPASFHLTSRFDLLIISG